MTDDEAMETSTASTESNETRQSPPRPEMVRPVEGRVFAGVAVGVARYLAISPVLARVLFAVLTVFGGLGVALYLAGWLLIRGEHEAESLAQRMLDNLRTGPSWIGVALLALAAVIVLDNLTFLSGSLLWATVFIVIGVLLYRGDLMPRGTTPPAANGEEGAALATSSVTVPAGAGEDAGTPPPIPPQPYLPPAPPVPPPPPQPPSILGRLTIGVGLLALGVMAVLDNLTPLIEPQPRHYMALATVVLGLGLMVGGFAGRARWLILVGIFVIPPLLVSPAAEVDWEQGFDRRFAPTELTEIQPFYRAAAGRYEFDLARVPWDGETIELEVELAAGEILVIVPQDVAVTGTAEVSIGEIDTPDGNRAGVGEISQVFDIPGTAGTIDLDLQVGAGAIEINQARPVSTTP
ncbi:MAG TPA: PspC domain-containing protein [Acidimicrobiia bacterium]|nr:PspC domain-containing protein [Acidimicrobiia bacterium]